MDSYLLFLTEKKYKNPIIPCLPQIIYYHLSLFKEDVPKYLNEKIKIDELFDYLSIKEISRTDELLFEIRKYVEDKCRNI